MPKGSLITNEEVDNTTESGIYHIFGSSINHVSSYSIMVVFNDLKGYVIQLCFRLGEDEAGFRRFYNNEWGTFRKFNILT